MSDEAAIQQQLRLEAARLGWHLWRNNNGACRDDTGRLIRYGLANDSARLSKQIKSSDLIGWVPVLITPDMVGQTVAVFTSIEAKRSDWRLQPGDAHAQAQARWIDLVKGSGGYGGFVTDPSQLKEIPRRGD